MKKLILLCLLLGTTHVFAQSAATVLFATNKVVAKHNGVERALSRGSSLDAGDSIITSKGAKANIKYSNGTLVNIGENSNYSILAYSSKSSDVQIKAELTIGKINVKTNGKTKETLKTPVIAMAILGTSFKVYVPQSGIAYISVSEGSVQAGNTIITPGQSFAVTPGGITAAPFPRNGDVSAVRNAPGTISANTTSPTESGSVATSVRSKAIDAGYLETGTPTSGTGISGTETLGLIDTTQVVGTVTTSAINGTEIASMNTGLIDLTIMCQPF